MSLKSSPFCPKSSSKLSQSIIQDHMVSHYKKVYSAKSAIDTSVPKSVTHSVKYNDQIRRERSRIEGRPLSAQSTSRTSSRANIRASCSSAQSRVFAEESPYFCLGSSSVSNPRINTSFHAKQIVYPSYTLGSTLSNSHLIRPASELSYGRTDRQHSARSCAASGTQSSYNAFMDPVQKTYSGDLLQKHAHHFTPDKPFTPKTLKSNKNSYLSQYRYYTSPQRRPDQTGTSPGLIRQETNNGIMQSKEYSSADFDDPPQGLSTTEHEWSDDDVTHLSFSGKQSKGIQSRSIDHCHSPFRAPSPEGMKSPIMQRVSAEEEELMYLEFIADVTNEILVRGLFSDKLLEHVFERHIDMNRHRLDEDKMRHLLEVLRKDLHSPVNTLTSSAEPDKNKEGNLLHSGQITALDPGFPPTKKFDDLFSYVSPIKHCEPFESAGPLLISKPLHSSSDESIASRAEPGPEDMESHQQSPGSPHSNHGREIDMANEFDTHANPGDNQGALSKDLESLSVSSTHDGIQKASDQCMNTGVSLSDDEF